MDSLILAHNQLSKVPANVFSHLVQLNSLELEGNQITYVDKDAFAGLEGKWNIHIAHFHHPSTEIHLKQIYIIYPFTLFL